MSPDFAEKTIFSNLIDEVRKSLRYYVKSNNGNANFKRLQCLFKFYGEIYNEVAKRREMQAVF